VLESPAHAALFSERPAAILEVAPERAARVFQAARERSLLAWPAGMVAVGAGLRIQLPESKRVEWTVAELRAAVEAPLQRLWNEEIE